MTRTLRVVGDEAALTLRIGDAAETVARESLPDGPVELRIDADTERYRFAAVPENGDRRSLGSARTKYLSTEVAGGFTGVYLALYATGDGSDADRPARFRAFSYGPR